jgi:glutathione S-transferase
MTLELVCFKNCPYAQRALILLREKRIEATVTFIDKDNPPDWFRAIAPTGQVPLLRVDGQVLFESNVIVEYLDEISPPSLHPADPLRKAKNRAWIEFGAKVNSQIYALVNAPDADAFQSALASLRQSLQRVEDELGAGPCFNGAAFSLVDVAYAPPLLRLRLIKQYYAVDVLAELPKLQAWSDTLAQREGVQRSLVPEFPQLYRQMITSAAGHLSTRGA